MIRVLITAIVTAFLGATYTTANGVAAPSGMTISAVSKKAKSARQQEP